MAKIGYYGRPAPSGMQFDEATVDKWCTEYPYTKVDWGWLQPPWPDDFTSPVYGDKLKAYGKRLIIRSMFWGRYIGASRIPTWQEGTGWDVMYNDPSLYDTAVEVMLKQIDNFGQQNIYAMTISEEEPGLGYNWVSANINWEHFTHGWNTLYAKLKAARPSLKVYGNFNMDWLSDDMFHALEIDGLMAGSYYPDLELNLERWGRAVRLCTERGISAKDIFLYIYAATTPATFYTPSGDPTLIRPNFENALSTGVSNVGFYMARDGGTGTLPEERLLWMDYEPDGVDPKNDPYLHKQEMLALIEEYGEAPIAPPHVPGWAWPVGVSLIIGIALLVGRRKK